MNKVYGTTILISQAVHHGCGPDFVTRVLDTVQVKRRAEARSPSMSLLNLDHRRSQPPRRADIDPTARCPSPWQSLAKPELRSPAAVNPLR
jgi:hypothetical protein